MQKNSSQSNSVLPLGKTLAGAFGFITGGTAGGFLTGNFLGAGMGAILGQKIAYRTVNKFSAPTLPEIK